MADLTTPLRCALRHRRPPGWLFALAASAACHHATPEPPAPSVAAASTAAPEVSDPYHPAPRDTVDAPLYHAWQQYSLQCARCHGEDAQGSSFGPSLLEALRPEGDVPTRDAFLHVLGGARSEKGMPSADRMGLDSAYFDGLYDYLKGRSEGRFHGGRPARRER